VRYFILFCAANFLVGASGVRADSPDCDAIKTSLIPYQIKMTKEHSVWRELHTIQMVRDPSGSDAVSISVTTSTPYKRKMVLVNGFPVVIDVQYIRGKFHSRIGHLTREYHGIDPKQMDFRTDQKLSFTEKRKWIDGKVGERTVDVSYKYVKTENVTIGPCTFIAHFGEQDFTDGNTINVEKYFSWYFPDLRLWVGNPNPDVVFQDISTTLEPIEFAEPNWPSTPPTTDDH
jgi:hypothetical protein